MLHDGIFDCAQPSRLDLRQLSHLRKMRSPTPRRFNPDLRFPSEYLASRSIFHYFAAPPEVESGFQDLQSCTLTICVKEPYYFVGPLRVELKPRTISRSITTYTIVPCGSLIGFEPMLKVPQTFVLTANTINSIYNFGARRDLNPH